MAACRSVELPSERLGPRCDRRGIRLALTVTARRRHREGSPFLLSVPAPNHRSASMIYRAFVIDVTIVPQFTTTIHDAKYGILFFGWGD
ncbi:hypothetical protein CBM2623_B30117 [Cupriavidus taiwanensis]|nr:hypothetical protein CBM2623_B30117 [Cupriavidus taiwanensis]